MLLLDIKNIKKYYGERLILDAKDFKAYYGEIIGIVGANGSGKTTFLDIIAGRNIPEEGSVKLYGEISYITQLDLEAASEVNSRMAKEFELYFNSIDTASGGEKTRFKIASSLSENSSILLADEPTSNLDIQGIELLEKRLTDNIKASGYFILNDTPLDYQTAMLNMENGKTDMILEIPASFDKDIVKSQTIGPNTLEI